MVPVMMTVHEHDVEMIEAQSKPLMQVDEIHQSARVLGLSLLFSQIHAHIEKQLYSNWVVYLQTHSVFVA